MCYLESDGDELVDLVNLVINRHGGVDAGDDDGGGVAIWDPMLRARFWFSHRVKERGVTERELRDTAVPRLLTNPLPRDF